MSGLDPVGIVRHPDNGGPMKGATTLATLERLGVLPSFSRPRVSNDNSFSETLFRTLKYRPTYAERPFVDLAVARTGVAAFVDWYNHQHRHSAIRLVTPEDRHTRRDGALLSCRHAVYQRARRRPDRWSGSTRNWTPSRKSGRIRSPTWQHEMHASPEALGDNYLDTHRCCRVLAHPAQPSGCYPGLQRNTRRTTLSTPKVSEETASAVSPKATKRDMSTD